MTVSTLSRTIRQALGLVTLGVTVAAPAAARQPGSAPPGRAALRGPGYEGRRLVLRAGEAA